MAADVLYAVSKIFLVDVNGQNSNWSIVLTNPCFGETVYGPFQAHLFKKIQPA